MLCTSQQHMRLSRERWKERSKISGHSAHLNVHGLHAARQIVGRCGRCRQAERNVWGWREARRVPCSLAESLHRHNAEGDVGELSQPLRERVHGSVDRACCLARRCGRQEGALRRERIGEHRGRATHLHHAIGYIRALITGLDSHVHLVGT